MVTLKVTDAKVYIMMFVLAKQGRVITYNSKETRYDCSSVEVYIIATTHFAEQ